MTIREPGPADRSGSPPRREPDGPLAWQPSLFTPGDGGGDLSFDGVLRHRLDDLSWVDHVPGWLHDHDRLFAFLRADGEWRQRRRQMYENVVDEPRLVAAWPRQDPATGEELAVPAELERIRAALSERYRVEFDSILVNLYRDGRDSVAWHRDTVRRRMRDPVVATVSLGARRRFLLRRYGGGPVVLRLDPGEGDLVVMGGACQHDWEHTVPKEPARTTRSAGARMSVTLRHSRPGEA